MSHLNLEAWGEMFPAPFLTALLKGGILIKTEGLRDAVGTFQFNCGRVLFLSLLPKAIFESGRLFQIAESLAAKELGNDPFFYASEEKCKSIPSEVIKKRNSLLDQSLPFPFKVAVCTHPEEIAEQAWHHDFQADIDVLMSMQIVGTWTICETLFGDLWEAALNTHPIGLSDLKTKEGRSVPTNLIQLHGYDLRNKMGTILRAKMGSFSKLDGAIEAYKFAFSEQGQSIHDILADRCFRALSGMRNLIVHKAGVCDKEYHDLATQMPDDLHRFEIGKRIRLDGCSVSKVLVPCIKGCMELISAVDGWIIGHP